MGFALAAALFPQQPSNGALTRDIEKEFKAAAKKAVTFPNTDDDGHELYALFQQAQNGPYKGRISSRTRMYPGFIAGNLEAIAWKDLNDMREGDAKEEFIKRVDKHGKENGKETKAAIAAKVKEAKKELKHKNLRGGVTVVN